jgi:hypothetical protein
VTRETLDVTVLCHRESREAGERSHFVIERSLSGGEIPGCARDDKQQYSRFTPNASRITAYTHYGIPSSCIYRSGCCR